MNSTSVLIVGAGPTGLVLALQLTRMGIAVRIVDQTEGVQTTSRALAVHARTLEFYRQMGFAEELVDGGLRVPAVHLRVNGQDVARVPMHDIGEGQSPYPFVLMLPQDAHERMLVEHLKAVGVKVERRTRLLRFTQDADGVEAVLERPDSTEEACSFAYLAGCDGASSTVRHGLEIDFPGGQYEGLFFVTDVEGAGDVFDNEIHVDLDESDFLAVFPLKGQGRSRLVGVIQGEREVEPTFDDVRARVSKRLGASDLTAYWFSTYRVHHRVAGHFQKGRAFLLGDAAHIHSPVGGQGMNTGIGDAVNLGWKLAAVLNDKAKADLLSTYESERIGFARRLVATTDRAFTLIAKQGGVAGILRTRLAPKIAQAALRRQEVRRWVFRTVSQIGIRYRESALSEGQAGAVHGGDRLPWVEAADNFAPLATQGWQVHVYGKPGAGVARACSQLGIDCNVFAWQSPVGKAGLEQDALYLVRPDGYVALADARSKPTRLLEYFRQRGLSA